MDKKTNTQQEYITNEMINTYLKKHKYSDQNGVIHTIDNKYTINED
ncbi:hypothetical protein AB0Y20_01415 [Heyndrickxia oleronia]